MSAQLEMFAPSAVGQDLARARRERDKGIKKVSNNNATFLETMRGVARLICHQKGWVCSDDLRAWCDARKFYPSHFNAYGAILTKHEFVPGEYIVSHQVQGHGNRIRKWTLKPGVTK